MQNNKLSHGEGYTGTSQKFPTGEERPAYRGNKEYNGPVPEESNLDEVIEQENIVEETPEEEVIETPEEEVFEEGQEDIEMEPYNGPMGSYKVIGEIHPLDESGDPKEETLEMGSVHELPEPVGDQMVEEGTMEKVIEEVGSVELEQEPKGNFIKRVFNKKK